MADLTQTHVAKFTTAPADETAIVRGQTVDGQPTPMHEHKPGQATRYFGDRPGYDSGEGEDIVNG